MVVAQESVSAPRSRRTLRVKTLRSPACTRLTRVATCPSVRCSRAATSSRAAAANTSSGGAPLPSQPRSRASVSGSASATTGSCTLRTSMDPSGARNVTPMNAARGATSSSARSRAPLSVPATPRNGR